jgi:MoaA/NifB/PqqE/SkfB family radical SAM enzyme
MEDLILKGIIDGAQAFAGPEIVQFDITNRCNNNCLCCWNNSALLGEPDAERRKEKEEELPFSVIKKTIKELKAMGTKSLFFAGGGEPFIHPKIIDILRCAKECNMRVFINTNFTLIEKKAMREMVRLKVDLIHVSLLAATPRTYALIHPNKTEQDFYKIKEILKYAALIKKEKNQHLYNPLPHINLYYVIFNKNYREIKEMVDLAIEVKADSVEFTPVDIIPGKTDCLLLDKRQSGEVIEAVHAQHRRIGEYNLNEPVKTQITQKDNFIKRIGSEASMQGRYESETVLRQPCYAGWLFARIKASGDVNPCLKAHRICVGNIYRQPFGQIWNSPEEQLFRRKSFKLDFSDPYFSRVGDDSGLDCGCLKSCDNIQINIDTERKYGPVLAKDGSTG